jgi:hypothetical protein
MIKNIKAAYQEISSKDLTSVQHEVKILQRSPVRVTFLPGYKDLFLVMTSY